MLARFPPALRSSSAPHLTCRIRRSVLLPTLQSAPRAPETNTDWIEITGKLSTAGLLILLLILLKNCDNMLVIVAKIQIFINCIHMLANSMIFAVFPQTLGVAVEDLCTKVKKKHDEKKLYTLNKY